jgi:hypothetical protein
MLNSSWIKWSENLHNTLYAELSKTEQEMKVKSPEELTDIGWICKKMYEQLDDIRKEVDKLQSLAEKIACLKAATVGATKIVGQLATGTVDVSMSANTPHPTRNPEDFAKLCDYLGIPDEVVQNDLIHQFHWPSFKEYFSKCMSQGKPAPPGIDLEKTHTHYKLKYRGRK